MRKEYAKDSTSIDEAQQVRPVTMLTLQHSTSKMTYFISHHPAILKKEVKPIQWDIIQTDVTSTGEAMETWTFPQTFFVFAEFNILF